ncbi:MAG: P1 family peptidase, partial [Deltaproteobacteria bacterium]|nr:P1 family peptidase [Deltaproteobacteria bacterium]
MEEITLTDLEGLFVGHAEDLAAKTGCTAILAPGGVTASAVNPGFAPGSRETDLLKPENAVQQIHGVCLSGGSAMGLAAASGVARFLLQSGCGFDAGFLKVPIVPAAVIFDYPGNRSLGCLPDERMGFEAAKNASRDPVRSGSFGVGLSASSGKIGGTDLSSPSGLGSFGVRTKGLEIACLAVVNSLGSVVEPETGQIISGLRRSDGSLADRAEILETIWKASQNASSFPGHTVLAVIAVNSRLSKLETWRLAKMASVGLTRAIYPAHLLLDGDTVFALSTGIGPEADPSWLGALAADVVSEAIMRSVAR